MRTSLAVLLLASAGCTCSSGKLTTVEICDNHKDDNDDGLIDCADPGCFNESKTQGWPDVVCRCNHSDDQLLGTTYARTLKLAIDPTGLAYEVEPPQARADVLEYVSRGDIRHSSFAFRVFPGGDEWGVSEFNYPMRTLLSVQLVDVAPAKRLTSADRRSAATLTSVGPTYHRAAGADRSLRSRSLARSRSSARPMS